MRKALLSSTVTLTLILAAGPTFALDIGAGVGGGGSAGASSGGSSGSAGGSARADVSVNVGSEGGTLGSLASGVTGAVGGAQGGAAATGSTTTDAAASATASASGDIATDAVSLTERLAGQAVISADGARVGSVVGVGIDAAGQPASIHTEIGGFLGVGATPVQFPIAITTITEQNVQLRATQAQLSAFIEAQKNASANAGNGAASAELASNATAGVVATAAQ